MHLWLRYVYADIETDQHPQQRTFSGRPLVLRNLPIAPEVSNSQLSDSAAGWHQAHTLHACRTIWFHHFRNPSEISEAPGPVSCHVCCGPTNHRVRTLINPVWDAPSYARSVWLRSHSRIWMWHQHLTVDCDDTIPSAGAR